jgi:DNA-binding NarL/FixJ family response regulator
MIPIILLFSSREAKASHRLATEPTTLFENQRTLFDYPRTYRVLGAHLCIVFMTYTNYKEFTSDKRVTVLLAEESKLVREAWSLILRKDPRFQIIAGCGSPESALLQAKKMQPEIIIFEVKPPGLSGIEILPLLRKYSPESKVLAVSLYTIPNIARELMQAGASGFLTKTSASTELTEAMLKIVQGENYLCREIKNHHREEFKNAEDAETRLGRLNLREIEIIIGLKNGLDVKEIAEELKITVIAVEDRCLGLLKKLRLKETSELVDIIREHQTRL